MCYYCFVYLASFMFVSIIYEMSNEGEESSNSSSYEDEQDAS